MTIKRWSSLVQTAGFDKYAFCLNKCIIGHFSHLGQGHYFFVLVNSLLLRRTFKSEKLNYGRSMRVNRPLTSLATTVNNIHSANADISLVNEMGVCDNIASLTIDASNETTGVTSFASEACEAVDVFAAHRSKVPYIGTSTNTQDLKEYFRRPQIIASSTVPNGTRVLLQNFVADYTNIFVTAFPGGFSRLLGTGGLRFDMVFTLQIAATPFHQGVFSLNFQYAHNSAVSTTATFARCSLSAASTNLPHVRLDVSTDTMAVLRVPFLMASEFMPNLDLGGSPLGVIGVMGFNQLLPTPTVAGIAPMPYKIMLHLENLEIVSATPFVNTTIVPQSGGTTPLTSEFENEAYPYSSGLSSFGRTLRWVARGVPSLASLAGPPLWAISKAAGALRSFGFSKPLIQEPIRRVVHFSTGMENNVDVATNAVALSPFATTTLAVDGNLATTEVDEMSLPYVLSQWSQLNVGSFTTSQPVGTFVYATATSPSVMWFRSGPGPIFGAALAPDRATAGTNSFLPTTVMSVCSLFESWRGSFEYRFTFSKTKLHGGRLLLTYTPTRDISLLQYRGVSNVLNIGVPAVNPNGFISPTGISVIFDLRDSNVFTFDAPYLLPLSNVTFMEASGSVSLAIHDPLVGPATVSPTVDFMVEVRCKPGFDLITPKGPRWPAFAAGTVMTQSGGLMSTSNVVLPETITSESLHNTVGESVTSLKQLIMLPHITRPFNLGSNSTGNIWVPPWYHSNVYPATVPFSGTYLPNTFSIGGYIGHHYAFVNGGTDVYFYTYQDSLMTWAQIAGDAWNTADSSNTVANGPGSSANRIFCVGKSSLQFKVPAYQRTRRVNPATLREIAWTALFGVAGTPSLVTGNRNIIPPISARVYAQNVAAVAATCFMHRSASDDARAGAYMGPVPLLLPTTVVATGSTYDVDSVGFQ